MNLPCRILRCPAAGSLRLFSSSSSASEDIRVSVNSGVRTLTLNRPSRYNALTLDMMRRIPDLFRTAAENPDTRVMVLTGEGRYYSSGNDLGNFTSSDFSVEEVGGILRTLVQSFIDFPKPLVAAVNGPAIGIACTTLALCDAVYCAEEATFDTPFMKIGQSPEACSSYLFPKIMGRSVATEVLMFGRKLSSREAKEVGLVSQVFQKEELEKAVVDKTLAMAKLPVGSMLATKKLMRDGERQVLTDVNRLECELLLERWTSEECHTAVMAFLTRKK